MAEAAYLVDTSVWGRAHQEAIRGRLFELAERGALWTCRLVDLEVTYASKAADVAGVVEERLALPEAPISSSVLDRALRVAGELAAAGHHRGAKPVDLVIAAAAEAAGLAVLHYDHDYERIGSVTGQPAEWVAPAGSLPG